MVSLKRYPASVTGAKTRTQAGAADTEVYCSDRADEFVQIKRRYTPAWKRTIDIVGIVVVLPLLAPLFVLVAAYIKLVSRGPVLFVQSRVGFGGEMFRIFKFRTMHVPKVSRDEKHRGYVASLSRADGTNETGTLKKPDYKNELIPGGERIRKLSIDELPQLFNVLLGNMSLVGPRPDVLKLNDYQTWQLRRFEVVPGMTGLWQVSGKNRLSFDQMIDLDIQYIETRSIATDLRIICRTFSVLLFERNE
ncbi:putative sugar transferase EpsL [Novipirellula aureliae]|uniref:Putative sugar transferase EpsL n=1 Tax=Novipirellula aureliae TaxID=2527966 RepID=A0A5C6DLL8_9BACT|nr:sugar transferase [Novipirellula aureliae]TWU35809.1 putative sugar transferase EpsL [Novipirellula aureliae]